MGACAVTSRFLDTIRRECKEPMEGSCSTAIQSRKSFGHWCYPKRAALLQRQSRKASRAGWTAPSAETRMMQAHGRRNCACRTSRACSAVPARRTGSRRGPPAPQGSSHQMTEPRPDVDVRVGTCVSFTLLSIPSPMIELAERPQGALRVLHSL